MNPYTITKRYYPLLATLPGYDAIILEEKHYGADGYSFEKAYLMARETCQLRSKGVNKDRQQKVILADKDLTAHIKTAEYLELNVAIDTAQVLANFSKGRDTMNPDNWSNYVMVGLEMTRQYREYQARLAEADAKIKAYWAEVRMRREQMEDQYSLLTEAEQYEPFPDEDIDPEDWYDDDPFSPSPWEKVVDPFGRMGTIR